MWYPAIGGLFIGIGGFFEPRVLGVGYDTIHGLLRGEIIGGALIGLLIGKSLVWSIALGSGTSGGVLAPLLIMGGALGAFEAHFIPIGDAGEWAIISMAAMMAGTMRSPLTAMVFTLELTHDLNLLPALLVGSLAAHALTVLALPRSILTEKVARRGYHITREYSVDPLTALRVEEVMERNVPTVNSAMKVRELANRIARHDPELTRLQGIPIYDEEKNLVGIITRGDVLKSLEENVDENMTVLEAGSSNLIVSYPDEILHEAVTKMLRHDIGRLPVVERQNPRRLIGYLGRAGVMAARLKLHDEEHIREPVCFPRR
jgi:CBS domain-containing protein